MYIIQYIYRSIVCQLYTVCIQCTVYVFFFAGAMSLINTSSNMTAAKNAQRQVGTII